MGKPNRRVVLGVGARSGRYDLRFKRARAVYVEDVDDAPRMARAYPVAGAVVTGENIAQVISCVRELRKELAPSACIAVIDPNFHQAEAELRAAGATVMGSSWMHIQDALGERVRLAVPRRPKPVSLGEILPVLLPRRLQ